MILTEEIIEKGKSSRGGWSNQQWRALGVTNKQLRVSGWKYDILGTDIEVSKIKEFLDLKDSHFKRNKKRCDHSFKFVGVDLIECIYCKRKYPIDERSELQV